MSPIVLANEGFLALLPLLFGAFIVILVAVAVHNRKVENERAGSLASLAAGAGLTFQRDGAWLRSQLGGLHLFRQGGGRKLYNVLTSRQGGLDVFVFDYNYTISSGKSSSTYRQTVAAFRLAEAAFTAFELRPEGWGHRFLSVFGYQDIDLPAFPAFSEQFLLRGAHEAAIRRLFTRPVVGFLSVHGAWCVEAAGNWLVCYVAANRQPPLQALDFLASACELADLLHRELGQVDK